MPLQTEINSQNRKFWDELCGTPLAKSLGVTDASPSSLMRFDDWYFNFYPYLFNEIPFQNLSGKRVLEVGLGYGTVGQRLAEEGASYIGLDIAWGPVAMMRHRLRQIGNEGEALQGSILDCGFVDHAFDSVVAIGSYHHTGDLQGALDQTYRILKPGGTAYIMVYNAYSYRRFLRTPYSATKYFIWENFHYGNPPTLTDRERGQYDKSEDGRAAPHTVFTSSEQIKGMCRHWASVSIRRENIAAEGPFLIVPRKTALRYFGRKLGLDLYCTLTK